MSSAQGEAGPRSPPCCRCWPWPALGADGWDARQRQYLAWVGAEGDGRLVPSPVMGGRTL